MFRVCTKCNGTGLNKSKINGTIYNKDICEQCSGSGCDCNSNGICCSSNYEYCNYCNLMNCECNYEAWNN